MYLTRRLPAALVALGLAVAFGVTGAPRPARAPVPARSPARRLAPAGAPALPALPALPAHPGPADLAPLEGLLARLETRLTDQAAALTVAAARSAGLQVALGAAQAQVASARAALDAAAQAAYLAGDSDPFAGWSAALLAGLVPFGPGILSRIEGTAVTSASTSLLGLQAGQARLAELAVRADARRARLLGAAERIDAEVEQVRTVLAAAQQAAAGQARELAVLAAQARALRDLSAGVALSVAPALSPAERATTAGQAPLVAALAATPMGQLPPGFHPAGPLLTGVASWYGPGFVGDATASGAIYNPGLDTAAMLLLPLGTVVHVTAANGRSVNVLVNDRGPYVAGRIIDLSEAAAATLELGLGPVTVEVLARG